MHIDKTGKTKPIQQNYGNNSKPYIHGMKNYFVNDTQQNKVFKLDDWQKMSSLKKKGSCEENINKQLGDTYCEILSETKGESYKIKYGKLYGPKPSAVQLASTGFGRASKFLSFTSEATFEHIVLLLFKSNFLVHSELGRVTETHPLIKHLHKSMFKSLTVNFEPLGEEKSNYENQLEPCKYRRQQLVSAAIYYNLDIASVIRYVGGTYTGDFRDPSRILARLKPLLPCSLHKQVKRVYEVRCPAKFYGHSTKANFWVLNSMETIIPLPKKQL